MIEREAVRAGCRHVDGIDAAEDERTGLRNVTGARYATMESSRDSERVVVGRCVERDAVGKPGDGLRQVLEVVAVHVWCRKDNLVDGDPGLAGRLQILQSREQRAVAHAVRD